MILSMGEIIHSQEWASITTPEVIVDIDIDLPLQRQQEYNLTEKIGI
jgi:hypothetical protein